MEIETKCVAMKEEMLERWTHWGLIIDEMYG